MLHLQKRPKAIIIRKWGVWGGAREGSVPSRARYQVFIESKKYALPFGVSRSLPSRNSIASTVPIGLRMRRSTYIFLRMSGGTSSSSLRVPDRVMSIAGKTRLSATLRSRMISELPVPLNSSKITSSMRRAGFDQRRGDDGQRAAFLDVARGAEEALRALQRVGVDAACQHLARGRHDGVIGAAETRDRIEQDHHVASMLDQALGLFDHHFGDLNVARRRFVEGRGDHFAAHRALHVRHFFRALVDQQHDQIAFRMIGRDRLRDVLQQHGLAGARRRDDQGALALADRRDEIDDARGQFLARWIFDLELQPLIGIKRRQIVERNLVPDLFGILEIDRVDLQQGEIALALLGAADDALDRVAGAKPEFSDLRGRNIDVVRARRDNWSPASAESRSRRTEPRRRPRRRFPPRGWRIA